MKKKDQNSNIDLRPFFPDSFDIVSVDRMPGKISIKMHSNTKEFTCPVCGTKTSKHQGTHTRMVKDLPILGMATKLEVTVFDYKCQNPECSQYEIGKSEDFPEFIDFRGRRTERLNNFILALALETSCEACSRIMKQSGTEISGDTIIRMLVQRYRLQEVPPCGTTIGVDDFSFKKRKTYGTIIVDEETHKPVAVLDGRNGDSLKEWLKCNKQVTAVTRDRASAYAKAVEEILPNCIQVADRFHVHQNLLEAVNKVLGREIPAVIRMLPDAPGDEKTAKTLDSIQDESKLSTNGSELPKKEPVPCG